MNIESNEFEASRLNAVAEAQMAEWSASFDDNTILQTQYLGFTCKISQRSDGTWIAWVSLNGGCRVIDRGDAFSYENEALAKGDALKLAFEDTFGQV